MCVTWLGRFECEYRRHPSTCIHNQANVCVSTRMHHAPITCVFLGLLGGTASRAVFDMSRFGKTSAPTVGASSYSAPAVTFSAPKADACRSTCRSRPRRVPCAAVHCVRVCQRALSSNSTSWIGATQGQTPRIELPPWLTVFGRGTKRIVGARASGKAYRCRRE